MTYDVFLDLLRQTPRTWIVTSGGNGWAKGLIRTGDHEPPNVCPVVAVGVSFTEKWAVEVACAADNPYASPSVRRDLLAACDLTEVTE